jgi:FkbM family methyltransferase
MSFKNKILDKISFFISRFEYAVRLCRVIVRKYDNDVNSEIDKNGELNLLKFLAKNFDNLFAEPNVIFFDVGANIGSYTNLLHNEFHSRGGAIYSFDPSLDNIRSIKKLSLPGLNIIESAVSDFDGSADFYENTERGSSGTDSLFDMNNIGYMTNSAKRSVKVLKLDTFCSENKIRKISFLKMDIEGNEFNALRGAETLLSENRIDFIQFEFGHAARAARVLLKDIIDLLMIYGYETYVIKPLFIEKVTYDPFFENRYNMINFLAFRPEKAEAMSNLIR